MFYFAKPFGLKSDQHLISPNNINKHKRKTSIQAVWVEGIARIICEVTFLSRTCYWYHENEVLGSFTTRQITLEVLHNERLLLLKNVKEKSVDVITFGDLSYIMNFMECDGFFPEQR